MIIPDFYAVELAIQRLLKAAAELGNASIDVETELSFQDGDIIKIYLDRWDALESMQVIAAGQVTKIQVQFVIWCFHCGIELDGTMRRRNELVGIVQTVLMRDRTFQETVEDSWMTGGEFQTVRTQTGFCIGGEIRVTAEMQART